MSQKTAKAARKELKDREQGFLKAMDEISKEFKIGLQPVLQFTPTGVVPAMRLIDELGQYENLTPEAKAQNDAERESKSENAPSPEVEPA